MVSSRHICVYYHYQLLEGGMYHYVCVLQEECIEVMQGTHFPLFTDFLRILLPFPTILGVNGNQTLNSKNHHHYSNLIANQACYTFWHVLSYFQNENKLTKLIHLISGCKSIFMYNFLHLLISKMANFILLTWLRTNFCVTCKTSIGIQLNLHLLI